MTDDGVLVDLVDDGPDSPPVTVPTDRLWTLDEAAAYVRMNVATLTRAVTAGELKAGGNRGRRLFRREDLEQWVFEVMPARTEARREERRDELVPLPMPVDGRSRKRRGLAAGAVAS